MDTPSDFRPQGWTNRIELADGLALLEYEPPTAPGLEHEHTYGDDPPVLVAPGLGQHDVTVDENGYTIRPSILCDCGLHGWVTNNQWRSA